MFTNVLSSSCRRAVLLGLCALSLTAVTRAQTTTTIIWPNPDPISVGTPLGSTQLNARAVVNEIPVEGTFVYAPPAGTILAVGTHTLSVTFTPAASSFTQAFGTATIDVLALDRNFQVDTAEKIL